MESLLKTTRKHDIAFHANGRIDISAHVARQLSLSPGDVVDITRHRGEWYVSVKLRAGSYSGRHEGKAYATSGPGRGGSFRVWSRRLAAAVLKAAGRDSVLRCPCGETVDFDNRKYVTLIYRCSL